MAISTNEQRSKCMSRIRSRDTSPEMVVRRLVTRLGYGYRLHRKDLPGRPDLAFIGRRKVIFVHGCFWHCHEGCKYNKTPKSNQDYWIPKLQRNVERDRKAISELNEMGWSVLVVWECETENIESLNERLEIFLKESQG